MAGLFLWPAIGAAAGVPSAVDSIGPSAAVLIDAKLEAIRLIMERINHVEALLVGSLLGFFLTATGGGLAAAYGLRDESLGRVPGLHRRLFYGISIVYALISGFFNYMLAQYYAAVTAVIPLAEGSDLSINKLYDTIRLPGLGLFSVRDTNVAMLASVPVFPFLVSVFLSYGFYVYICHRDDGKLSWLDMGAVVVGYLIIDSAMLYVPFTEFLRAAGLCKAT